MITVNRKVSRFCQDIIQDPEKKLVLKILTRYCRGSFYRILAGAVFLTRCMVYPQEQLLVLCENLYQS